MNSPKSVKLGGIRNGIRNAMRRLLRKPLPAADASGGFSPAGGQHVDSGFPNGNANGASSAKDLPPPSLNHVGNPFAAVTAPGIGNHSDDWSQALNGDFSDIVKSHAHDDEAIILRNTAVAADNNQRHEATILRNTAVAADVNQRQDLITTDDSTMAPPQPLMEQTRPTQKAPVASSHIQPKEENKENVPPERLTDSLASFKIADLPQKCAAIKTPEALVVQEPVEADEPPDIDYSFLNDPVIAAERAQHLRFIGEALDMARLALKINETPVGCVLVHDGKVIARGMNATNVTRNGTRHAEYMALAALFSYPNKEGPRTVRLKPKELTDREEEQKAARLAASEEERAAQVAAGEQEALDETELPDAISETLSTDVSPHEGNEDGKKGHLYPYGQKMLEIERVDRSIVSESVLYVTVEPCIMCASLLRQLKIKKVYFGAVNDKFGGTGGVFSLHANSLPVREDGQTASAHPISKPIQLPDGTGGSLGVSFPPGGGDGGNVERGYEIEGGWGRDDAVALLRRFYVQENGRAPVPRKKEGRAARLAAMMGQDDDETATPSEGADTNEAGDDGRKESSESSFDDSDGDELYDA